MANEVYIKFKSIDGINNHRVELIPVDGAVVLPQGTDPLNISTTPYGWGFCLSPLAWDISYLDANMNRVYAATGPDIAASAFANQQYCDGLVINSTVKTIGDHAFEGWPMSKSVTFLVDANGNGVETIGNYAFNNWPNATSLTLPKSVISIGDYGFYNWPVATSLTFSKDDNGACALTTLGRNTFTQWANATALSIPCGVSVVPQGCFGGWNSATSLTFEVDPATGFSKITTIGMGAFTGWVTLSQLDIPVTVTTIEASAFSGCGAANLIIPDSVTSVGSAAFADWSKGVYAKVGSGITTLTSDIIGRDYGYWDNNLNKTVWVNNGATFNRIDLSEGLLTLGDNCFKNWANLTSIIIPNSVTSIGANLCLNDKSIQTVVIGNGVVNIPANAFSGLVSATSLIFGQNVATIGDAAFAGWVSYTGHLTLPNTITTIGANAFASWYRAEGLTIGSGLLTNATPDPFSNWYSARTLVNNSPNTLSGNVFTNWFLGRTLQLAEGTTAFNGYSHWGGGLFDKYFWLSLIGYPVTEWGTIAYTDYLPTVADWPFTETSLKADSILLPSTVQSVNGCSGYTTVDVVVAGPNVNYIGSIDSTALVLRGNANNINVDNSNISKAIIYVEDKAAFKAQARFVTDAMLSQHHLTTDRAIIPTLQELHLSRVIQNATPWSIQGWDSTAQKYVQYNLGNTVAGSWVTDKNVNYLDEIIFSDIVTDIGPGSIAPRAWTTSVLFLGNSLNSIGDNAFANSRIFDLQLPNTITTIGANAFRSITVGDTNLMSVNIGSYDPTAFSGFDPAFATPVADAATVTVQRMSTNNINYTAPNQYYISASYLNSAGKEIFVGKADPGSRRYAIIYNGAQNSIYMKAGVPSGSTVILRPFVVTANGVSPRPTITTMMP
ncbi:MAG: hypothetical protein [Bacteriophage sp.]|nr:MAG: hypothetical protein [Bacteriophage sp.]